MSAGFADVFAIKDDEELVCHILDYWIPGIYVILEVLTIQRANSECFDPLISCFHSVTPRAPLD